MDINAVAGAQSHSAAKSATTGLVDNFETFLTLLTAQLKNQDPLAPMDSGEFTSQLVQFTSVEQAIATNQHLENLVSMASTSSANAAVSYIGKEVTVDSFTSPLINGEAGWSFTLPEGSVENVLTVTDKNGSVVYTQTHELAAGTHTYMWDGKDTNGNQMPDGDYNLVIRSRDADGVMQPRASEFTGVVGAVIFENGQPLLDIGGKIVRISDIKSIVDTSLLGMQSG
jgi:flagellar basal-body rod modification protein FlgD